MPEALIQLWQSLNRVDAALLAVLLLSLVVGWVRGFAFEAMSLVGWLVAYFAAVGYWTVAAPYLPIAAPGSALQRTAAMVVTFVVVLVGWTLVARLVRLVVRATPLDLLDRVCGSAFGLARGVVILLVVATLVAMTPGSRARAGRDSAVAGVLNDAVAELRPLFASAPGRSFSSR